MKQILLSLLAFLTIYHASAQITLEAADYFPILGDTLRTSVDVDGPDGFVITPAGGDQTWDFTNLEESFELINIYASPTTGTVGDQYPTADLLLTQIGGVGEGYYTSTPDAFSVIAYAGADPLGFGLEVSAPFNPAYVDRWAPLAFFDVRNNESALQITVPADQLPSGILDSLPITPDSLRVSINTSRTDIVDAWGTLEIPSGTFDVLREKRTEERELTLEAKVGFFPWVDVTDIVTGLLMLEELGINTSITYSYWSSEAKEPIAVVTTNEDESEIQQIEYKKIEIVNSTSTTTYRKPGVAIYPNPAMVEARLRFEQLPNDDYRLEIFNLTGKQIAQRSFSASGTHEERLDVTVFPKGLYLCTLKDINGQPLLTRRLLVTKP
ncbi:MAG: T9SS type A sorting domain-containing protein [Bacteroidota bacterium]